jgi:thiamine biosynthesis lipoprotein
LDAARGLVTVPRGVALDLGATAKAATADRAASALSARYRVPVLIELGGDIAVAGEPEGGWRIEVAERTAGNGPLIVLPGRGIATSTTTVRQWQRGPRTAHHIIDPRTGAPAMGRWRTATVIADSAFAANTASTAAIVLGDAAVGWLEQRTLAARLIDQDGSVTVTTRWPAALVTVAS